MRVGVAGAGLAGRLITWRLAQLGHEVHVFDPAVDAAAPTGVAPRHGAAAFSAAGVLSPVVELEGASPDIAAWGWRSLELWSDLIDTLAPELNTPILYRRNGSMVVAHARDAGATERALARMKAAQAKAQRALQGGAAADAGPTGPREADGAAARPVWQPPQALDADTLRSLEPALARGLQGWLLPGDGQIDTARLLPALCAAAPSVQWHWRRFVEQVDAGRLRFEDGSVRNFDFAIDTRGLGARPALPLRGLRSEQLWLYAPEATLRRPVRSLLARHRLSLVPRQGDILIVGATEIDSEDRSPVSARAAVELLSDAQALLPELAEARIVRLDTQLRPAMPDQRPVLHYEPGLLRLNGLYRHGFLLAPAMVEEALLRSGIVRTGTATETSMV